MSVQYIRTHVLWVTRMSATQVEDKPVPWVDERGKLWQSSNVAPFADGLPVVTEKKQESMVTWHPSFPSGAALRHLHLWYKCLRII